MVGMRRKGNWFTRLAAIALAACVCAGASIGAPASASAATTAINGISDQNLGVWSGDYQDGGGNFTVPFDDFFAQTWVGSPASHLAYARFVTAPDAVAQGGACEQNLTDWFHYVTQVLHLTPVIAVWNVAEGGCANDGHPSTAAYATEIAQLLDYLDGLGWGDVGYLEAWNEPNSSSVPPAQAAAYWTAANAACQPAGCTAIAGDFVDNDPDQGSQSFNPTCTGGLTYLNQLVPYETAYIAALAGAAPAIWGFHPYYAVNCEQSASVTAFEANLPKAAAQVWFTEVAAWECVRVKGLAVVRGTTQQAQDAGYLVNTLIPASSPSAVFYYEMAAPNYTLSCAKYSDSELFEASTSPGPLLARPAAAIIYGPDTTLAGVTGAPTAVSSTQATFTGTLVPGGLYEASYHFDYGPTSAYGSQTPEALLPPGLAQQPASATVAGLAPNTAYHYQLVVTDTNGQVVPGGDVTMPPVTIATSAATVTTATPITVTWGGISDPSNTDWVGLYQPGAPAGSYAGGFYADSCTQASNGVALASGACTFTMPQAAGTYEFRLYSAPGSGLLNTSAAITSVPPPPVDNVAPLISGASSARRAYPGQTLSCSSGAWTNAPTAYAYQWLSDGSPLAGATGQIYMVLPGELGDSLSCSVVASNAGGSGAAATSAGVAIRRPPPSSTAPPTISGHAIAGSLLVESHARWSNAPTSFAYQWQRCNGRGGNCRPIAGATTAAYRLAAADRGSTIRVVETARNASGLGVPARSLATGVVAMPPAPDTVAIAETVDGGGRTATFRFRASGSASGLRCALVLAPARSARFLPCRSPKTYRALAAGSYAFEARAIGVGGYDPSPLVYRFTIP